VCCRKWLLARSAAAKLFQWGLVLNANCTLCHQSLGDVWLRLGKPREAEAAMRLQVALLPHEADGHFALGVALRKLGRDREALAAYETALALAPNDAEGHVNLGAVAASLGDHDGEVAAYRSALAIKPDHAAVWINLGAVLAASLRRPAEASHAFRRAAAAYAHAGRLAELAEHLTEARRTLTRPGDRALTEMLQQLADGATRLASARGELSDHPAGVCGTPCAQMASVSVDAPSADEQACALTWTERCGDEHAPPEGFDASRTTVADVCARSCAAHALERHAGKIRQSKVTS
jgi:tetratricopeptide (TPR) repeat protein